MSTRRSIEIIKNGKRIIINFPSMPEKWNNNINGFTINDEIYKLLEIQHNVFMEMEDSVKDGENYQVVFGGTIYKIDKTCKV